MERGVIVGGLMICGSFLVAALLNRSAMEEVPAPTATPPAVVSPTPQSDTTVKCAHGETRVDPDSAAAPAEPARSGLMVNGNEGCPR